MASALPSKKQHALLEFIDTFIAENNYAPSYREMMRALDYKSVSTVATHINGLIERGWLVKRDNEKRSLEVVYKVGQTAAKDTPAPSLPVQPVHKLSEQELLERLNEARTKVKIGANYTHFKGGSYKVIDLVIQAANDEVGVVYQAQYGENVVFVRPLIKWLETVEVDGEKVNRFKASSL